jgi:hypothetical protein
VDDNVEIQAAINALPSSGGRVQLLEGTFVLDAPNEFYPGGSGSLNALNLSVNNMELVGVNGTTLKLKDGLNVNNGALNSFLNILQFTGNDISVRCINFDSNEANVTADYNVPIWEGNDPTKGHRIDISYNKFFNYGRWAFWGDSGGIWWNIHHNYIVPGGQGGISLHNGPQRSQICNNFIASDSTATVGVGIFLDSVDHVLVAGNYIQRPQFVGIQIYDAVNSCKIINNVIRNYFGSAQAIQIYTKLTDASICDSNIVSGNHIVNVPTGINIQDAYCTNTLISGNQLVLENVHETVNMATAVVSSASNPVYIVNGGTGTIIKNNIGYKNENTGTATITAGQTSVNVTHGLAAAPTRVLLTPTTATAGKQYYVSSKAATTFTITIDSAHASDISFDWQAVI